MKNVKENTGKIIVQREENGHKTQRKPERRNEILEWISASVRPLKM